MLYYQRLATLLFTLIMLLLHGCATHQPTAPRYRIQNTEKICVTLDCFMNRLGRYAREEGVNDDGNKALRWYMSVRKYRMQRIGEGSESDTRNYEYYWQDCWFTGIFDASGNLLSTEWEGPGCYGRGN